MTLPVDRRLFVPDVVWVVRDGRHERLSRREEPDAWERLVASEDAAITTKLKDGIWPVSSSSAPSVMARMIEVLAVEPGMKVLEIGTGTGYNAACLAALGAEVVSVEIDPDLADQARGALRDAGAGRVVVLTGDGALGAPADAPFDRVVATAAVHTVPYAWVQQTRDGGRIVTPYTGENHRGALLVLTVRGGTAAGGVAGDAAFMPLSGQKLSQVALRAIESRPGLRLEVTASGQRFVGG
jgi:protein-L-isoaspartate(D-aspartate) O-methyltransferase